LDELAELAQDEFLADVHRIGSAKYHFVVAIECCLDMANHVIASENYRLPKDSADSFVVLVEEGILPAGIERRLQAMARFRNRLVHLYWKVDHTLVYQYLQEGIGDLRCVGAAIAEFAAHSQ
jgi:uncharacterized protein YutE (UPF0331/DUF86 family)